MSFAEKRAKELIELLNSFVSILPPETADASTKETQMREAMESACAGMIHLLQNTTSLPKAKQLADLTHLFTDMLADGLGQLQEEGGWELGLPPG